MNVATILKEKGRDVLTAASSSTLLEIANRLAENKVGCIVVTDDKGHIVGIVSERDVVRRIAKTGGEALKEPVSTFMTKKVVTCQKADTIEKLMAEMTAGRFRHLPVVEDGRLAGLVSIGDVVKQRIAEAEMEAAAMREYITTG